MTTEHVLNTLSQTLEASVSPYHCIKEATRQLTEASFHSLSLTGTYPRDKATMSLFSSPP